MTIEIEITKEYDGVKPKNFLKKRIDLPFDKIVKLILDKRITLNGKKIKKEDVLKNGDIVKIWPNDVTLREAKKNHENSQNLGLECIFDNEDFAVFNKTADIVVQGAQHKNTAISLHLAWYKEHLGDNSDFEYFHAHRLDKDTSGALVVAKTLPALRELNRIFRGREITKKYMCICLGEFEEKEGKVELFLKKNPEGSREKMSICSEKDEEALKSISLYKVLEEYEIEGETLSLVEVEIKTGITHQIRVHMKSLGHPILMDTMYGNSVVNKIFEPKLKRQFLHSTNLAFEYEGKKFEFTAGFTPDLIEFMEYLEENREE